MPRRHRSHSAEFKRQVVASYQSGEALHALSRRHDLARNLIRIGIATPNLLSKVVAMIDGAEMVDRDTKGGVYEYMLGKIASAGQTGQVRTPRHIIQLMVGIMAPTPEDTVCDPACGSAGFLVATGEYLRREHPELFRDARLRSWFHNGLFNGFDFDGTMLRIGAMNMALHGVDNPDIAYRESLAEEHVEDAGAYLMILANPRSLECSRVV